MNSPIYLSQVAAFPGSSTSVLGTPLPRQMGLLTFAPPIGKLPINFFPGYPVVVEETGLDSGLYACGHTNKSVAFRVPKEYRGDVTVPGTVVQEMTMFWVIQECRTNKIIAYQEPATFWEGFEVAAGNYETTSSDSWWLDKPPTGPGTFGTALWIGVAAFFPDRDFVQCGLYDPAGPNSALAHPLSGDKPSSRTKPIVWQKGPLPESNAAWRRLVRVWKCCPGQQLLSPADVYEVEDVSSRFTLPEEPREPGKLEGDVSEFTVSSPILAALYRVARGED